MIELHDVEMSGRFKYLWLKYVTGYNLNVHCARSLKGEYSVQINTELKSSASILLNEFPSHIVYLCGVATPYKWENNFHLALIESPGATVTVDDHGISLKAVNAVSVPFDMSRISMEAVGHSNIQKPAYRTCRNWQFANYLHHYNFFPKEQ